MSQVVSRIGHHLAGGTVAVAFVAAFVGCESHQVTWDLAIVATDVDTGLPVEGVRIAQHVDGGWLQGLADDALGIAEGAQRRTAASVFAVESVPATPRTGCVAAASTSAKDS